MWQHTHRAHAQTYVSVQTLTSTVQKLEIPEFHVGVDRMPSILRSSISSTGAGIRTN